MVWRSGILLLINCFFTFFILLHLTKNSSSVQKCPREEKINWSVVNTEGLSFVNQSFYDGIAMLVDNRPSEKIPFHLFNVMVHIPVTWPVQIFYSEQNGRYLQENLFLKSYLDNGRVILTKLFDERLFHLPNDLYTNVQFWEQVRGEKILNFQLDSVLCSNSPHRLSDYLAYDYIGAPWHLRRRRTRGYVGNSGFSLRSRKKTIELLSKYPYDRQSTEDQWFAEHFHLVNASLPTFEIASTFAVESAYYHAPLAIHMPGIFLQETQYQALCKQCPETRMVWPYCQHPHPLPRP